MMGVDGIIDAILTAFCWGIGIGLAYFAIWGIQQWVTEVGE